MGTSSRPRKNPFEGQGLVPGLTLHLEFTVGERLEATVTQVQEVDAASVTVLVPMQRLRKRPIPAGQAVGASYVHQRVQFRFVSSVRSHSEDGELEVLDAPRVIRSSERRGAFRLTTALRPSALYRLVVDRDRPIEDGQDALEGMVVDVSEGGVCLSTRFDATIGERFGMQVDLPVVGRITTRLRVAGIEEPLDGRRNRRIHCAFIELGRADRERIARYLMRRQLELRRRGQL
jgi:c-di-GMP-binding flagellar brake protein YcgR